MNTQQKLAASRLWLLKRAPYWRAVLMRMVWKEAPGLGTFGVSARGVCMFDPAVVERWTTEEIGSVTVHELEHLRRNHNQRGKAIAADHFEWNCAGDREINDDLVAGGWTLPDEPLMPADIGAQDGRLAEEYFRTAQQNQGQPKPSAGKGKGKGKAKGAGAGGDTPGVGHGQCGGCAGNPNPGEAADGGAEDGGMSDAEAARVWRETAEAVNKHVASHGRGSVPSDMLVWAEETIAPPKVRWQDKLARLARRAVAYRAGAVDYRYDRPSRRQSAIGYGIGKPVLPALRSPIPRVAIALDTSGSMGTEEVGRALAEARGVLLATGAEV